MKSRISQPLVCVMMPVYNGEKTLELAINSLLKQTYHNWKCIIVNDGSSDGTKKYLDTLIDSRFKIIHFHENLGRPKARQTALEISEGEYLAFLDADDFYHPRKLEMQVDIFLKFPEIDLVSCGMGSYNDSFELVRVRGVNSQLNNKIMNYHYTGAFRAPHAASMTRIDISKSVGYNDSLRHAQDSDFFIRYMEGRKYFIVKDILYYYSEFTSVTGLKILKTYYYDILRNGSMFAQRPILALKAILTTIIKCSLTALLLPITGPQFFIKRRGAIPSQNASLEFNQIKKILNVSTQLGA